MGKLSKDFGAKKIGKNAEINENGVQVIGTKFKNKNGRLTKRIFSRRRLCVCR